MRKRRRRLSPALAGVVLGMLVVNLLVWQRSTAAFTATTVNSGNAHNAASLTLTDNDSSDTLKMFNLSNMTPGSITTSCITLNYSGTVPALVNLYGSTTGGNGLGTYLDLIVWRGTYSSGGGFGDCSTFVADPIDFVGDGNGVLFNNTLAGYPTSAATGIADLRTPAVPEAWTAGESHVYKFQISLQNNVAAQAKTATYSFSWQASNATLYSQLVRSEIPSSYWKMDEAAGTVATDAMGAANGTYTNGPVVNQTTGVDHGGTAVSFDGTNDYVNVSDVYDFAGTASFTVECWFQPTTVNQNSYRDLVTKTAAGGWWMQIIPHNDPVPADQDTLYFARSGQSLRTNTKLVADNWYHGVATYDGTTLRLYLNGALEISTASASAVTNTAATVRIGKGNSSGLGGKIDEVAIYSYALTAGQIADHYNAGQR